MKLLKATPKHADKITQLRIDAYHYATNTKITDFSFLHWNKTDDENMVLFIENDEGKAIASIRGVIFYSKEEVEKYLDVSIDSDFETPILIMDKMTTDISCRGQGMSNILRYFYMDACINSMIKNSAFTVNDGVSRIPFYRELGFTLEKVDTSHREKIVYENTSDVLFARLHHTDFVSARQKVKETLKLDLAEFTEKEAAIKAFREFVGVVNLTIE